MSNLQTPKLKFRCDNTTIPVSEESHSPSAYIHTFKLVLLLTTSWNSRNRSTMWYERYLNSSQCQNTWETLYLLKTWNKKLKWSLEFTGRLGTNLCICEHGFIILVHFTQKFGRIIKLLQHQKHFFSDNVRNLKQNHNWTTSLAVLYHANITGFCSWSYGTRPTYELLENCKTTVLWKSVATT